MEQTRVDMQVNVGEEIIRKGEWTRPELKVLGMEDTNFGPGPSPDGGIGQTSGF